MAYIGNQAQTAFTSFDKQTITGDGTVTYTLSHSVANAEVEVFVNNVRQEGGSQHTQYLTTRSRSARILLAPMTVTLSSKAKHCKQ